MTAWSGPWRAWPRAATRIPRSWTGSAHCRTTYNECVQAFSQFGSDLDADTKKRLNQGERIVEVLKQPQNSPIPVEKQVIIIFAVVSGELLDIPVELIGTFQKELFEYIDGTYGDIPETIRATGKLEDDIKSRLTQAIEEFKKKFLSEH